jgi:hypothetical protein
VRVVMEPKKLVFVQRGPPHKVSRLLGRGYDTDHRLGSVGDPEFARVFPLSAFLGGTVREDAPPSPDLLWPNPE